MATMAQSNTPRLPERTLYQVKEARQLWGGMAQSTFYRFVTEQQIRLVKIGRRTYVPHDEIMRITRGARGGDA
jgi:hypothetical protein